MKITNSFPKFYYEYYDSDGKLKSIEQDEFSSFIGITNPSEIAYLMCCRIPVQLDDDQKVSLELGCTLHSAHRLYRRTEISAISQFQMLIFTRVRLSLSFHDYETRLQFVLARLQALSVLVYANSLQENINTLLYPGFLEELVELLEMREPNLVEIRAAALRTLTSIIHLDRNPHFPKYVFTINVNHSLQQNCNVNLYRFYFVFFFI